jgi:allophanate hydrolase
MMVAVTSPPTGTPAAGATSPAPTTPLVVVGAHLAGQPLHHELADRAARLVAETTTAPHYRFFALATQPPKPGLVRVAAGGAAIEVEVWELGLAEFGDFVRNVPPPLAIGTLQLADGSWAPGFVCEPIALDDATDITDHGGWRAFRRATT